MKQEIDNMIKNKQYNEAFDLCNEVLCYVDINDENYLKLQSRKIKILILKSKNAEGKERKIILEEVLKLIEEILSNPNLDFITQMIFKNQHTTVLIKLNRNEEALKLIEEILSNPSLDFTNQMIAKNNQAFALIKLNRNEEALKLTEEILSNFNLDFKTKMIAKTNQITALINLNRNEEALKLTEEILSNPNLDFTNQIIFKNQQTTVLIKLNRNEDALKIIEEILSNPSLDFKNQMIAKNNRTFALIKLNRNEEALKLTEEILSNSSLDFKNQMTAKNNQTLALIKLNRNEEALKLTEEILSNFNLDFKTKMIAKTNQITALINLNRNEEALKLIEEILSNPNLDFKNRMIFQQQKRIILDKLKTFNISDEEMSIVSILLTKIYCDAISLEELEKENISLFNRIILLVAYYEKHNKKQGIQFINQRKQEVEEKDQVKVLNMLKERLSSKKTMFDCGLYREILNCGIDWNLVTQIEKKKKENATIKLPVVTSNPVVLNIPAKEKSVRTSPSKMIMVEGKKESRVASESPHMPKVKNIQEKQILIKDIFPDEIMKMGSQVYVGMQSKDRKRYKDVIQAWNILENLSNKQITDTDALNTMISLTYRLQYEPVFMQPVDEENIAMRIKQYK